MVNNTELQPDFALAESLFTRLRENSFDGEGVTRDSLGEGEQKAHQLLRDTALAHGLQVDTDAAMNMYITLPGKQRDAPKVIIGSHLDSVPCGGNYDGAAGVLAGLAMIVGWKNAGFVPACDVVVMAIRAEESVWFPVSYLGSKAAFGLLTQDDLAARRRDSGKTVAWHMRACGGDPDALLNGKAALSASDIRCFFEVHIEQGGVLEEAGIPLGIVTGICGSLRYRNACALGTYGHSGATPRNRRQDAVLATAHLVTLINRKWRMMEAAGHELTATVGQFFTDPQQADFSKVSGKTTFCIDFRSRDSQTLLLMDDYLQQVVKLLTKRYGVTFLLGERSGSQPGVMDPSLQGALSRAAETLDLPARSLPCGAGHDCALIANQAVPAAMLFIRNQNGSHNPREAMVFSDFCAAVSVLERALRDDVITAD